MNTNYHGLQSALLLAVVACCLSSCGKIKDAMEKAKKEVESVPPAKESQAGQTPGTPAATAPVGNAEIRKLQEGEFAAFIAQPDRLVVIDFYADWCGPCRTLGPVLETVVASHGARVALGKLDVDQARGVATQHAVKSIPDVRLFIGGKQVDQFVGALPEAQVRERIQMQVDKLPKPAATDPAAPSTPIDKQPAQPIAPMEKDWLPPGLERRAKTDAK